MNATTSTQILKINFTLRIHSPVHIGGDQNYARSPYTDFVLSEDGQSICYIPQRRMDEILRVLASQSEDQANLVRQIRESYTGNRPEFDLRGHLIEAGIDPEAGTAKIRNYGYEEDDRVEINQMEKTAGRPYIPGSSLKGAFRTALLYDWYMHSDKGKREIIRIVNALPDLAPKIKRLNALRAKKRKFKRLPEWEFKEMGQLQKAEKQANWMFGEQGLFGKVTDKYDPNFQGPISRHLRFRDSSWTGLNDIGIWKMERIRLQPERKKKGSYNKKQGKGDKENESNIPMMREAFLPKTYLDAEANIVAGQIADNHALAHLKKDSSHLMKCLRQFSKANIQREIQELNDAKSMPIGKARTDLLKFYTDLLNDLELGDILIRVGGGKTYFDNALTLALLQHPHGNAAIWDFLVAFANATGHERFWPVTRTITQDRQQYIPPGWVEIQNIKETWL
ncbi:MAG: type III-A CRISPR-associated RAMP protein Csm5 [Bacteroidota bacterium]